MFLIVIPSLIWELVVKLPLDKNWPFNNSFEIKWDFNASIDKKMLMNVYNVLGEVILSTHISENNTKINANDWKNGTYFLKINNQVYKIIKH